MKYEIPINFHTRTRASEKPSARPGGSQVEQSTPMISFACGLDLKRLGQLIVVRCFASKQVKGVAVSTVWPRPGRQGGINSTEK